MSTQSSRSPSPSPSTEIPTPHPALELTDILEEIFSHLGSPRELLQYRLVCQQWNDVISHTLVTKWKNYFPLRLRYGPHVPLSLLQSEAEVCTREILDCPTITLTGTTTPLSFDTVVVDQDFYLAGVNTEWQHFLELYGESIRHLKFNIRSGEGPEENSHHVTDCAQVVSRENFRAAFYAMPNLESLDFSIRFSNYETKEPGRVSQRMFPKAPEVADLSQLKKLTKITIQEPHGVQYDRICLMEILGIAPNLTTLYFKCSRNITKFKSVLKILQSLKFTLTNSLTTLGITTVDRNLSFKESEFRESGFSRFHLTKLKLNRITGNGRLLEEFLYSQSPTLTTLILGDRVTPRVAVEPEPEQCPCHSHTSCLFQFPRDHKCTALYRDRVALPPRFETLKILEVNLPKFTLAPITDYPTEFPVLEELTFSNCEDELCVWTYQQLRHVLPGEIGHSHTLKKFNLLGPMVDEDRDIIIAAVRSTFPVAEHHFGL